MAPVPFPALEGVLACQHTWSAMMHHTPITASKQHNLTESSAYAALHLCFIGTSGDSPSLPAVLSLALVAPLGDVGCHHTRSAMMHQTPINASKQHNLTESSAYARFYEVFNALADGGIADQNVPCGASGRGDAEAFGTNSGPADSTSSKLPSTSQGSAKHAD